MEAAILKSFLEFAAKDSTQFAIYLGGFAVLALFVLRYLKAKAPAPRRPTVEKVLLIIAWGGLFLAVLMVLAKWTILFFKPDVTTAIHLNKNYGNGPETARLTYSSEGIVYNNQTLAGLNGTIPIPAGAGSIDLTDFDAQDYEPVQLAQGIKPPWHLEIKNHLITLDINYTKELQNLPTADVLYPMLTLHKAKELLATDATIPDDYSLTVKNESDDDMDVWFFNCRHFLPAKDIISEDEKTVTVAENNGISVYPKWIAMEELRSEKSATWNASQMRQFYKPSQWFALLAQYRRPNETKQREELLGCFDVFGSNQPSVYIKRATTPEKEFYTELSP